MMLEIFSEYHKTFTLTTLTTFPAHFYREEFINQRNKFLPYSSFLRKILRRQEFALNFAVLRIRIIYTAKKRILDQESRTEQLT